MKSKVNRQLVRVTIFAALIPFAGNATEPLEMSFLWATNALAANAYPTRVAACPSGGVYVAGNIEGGGGPVAFGGASIDGTDNREVFVSRVDDRGTPLWLRQLGGPFSDEADDLAVDPWGNPVLLFSDYSFNEDGTQTGSYSLVKFDSEGNILWERDLGTYAGSGTAAQGVDFRGLCVGLDGHVYVGSRDRQTAVSSLIHYDADGNSVWDRVIPYSGVFIRKIAPSSEGRIHVLAVVVGGNGPSMYLYQFDQNGVLQWTRHDKISATHMTISPSGQIFLAGGYCGGGAYFGDVPLASYPAYQVCVYSYSPEGQPLWVRQFGTAANQETDDIAMNGDLIEILGYYDQDTRIDDVDLTYDGPTGPFYQPLLMQLNASGQVQWVTRLRFGTSTSFALSADGGIYIAGSFRETMDFGDIPLQNPAGETFYIGKISSNPRLRHSNTANALVFSWQTAAKGYVLEQSTSLAPDAAWTTVEQAPVVIGNDNVVTVEPGQGVQEELFYRLRKL